MRFHGSPPEERLQALLSSLPMIPVLPWIPGCSKPEVWYECAYEWRIVSYAMHANARLNAKAAGKPLFYIPAVDSPACRMGRADYDDMRAIPIISTTAKLMGILPAHIGMDVILTEFYLPPNVVRGAVAEIVGIEFHAQEQPLHGRASLASSGCAILSFMPKCIYVRLRNSQTSS